MCIRDRYEAILSDADDKGLMVIFHGCTLPRGWERMYPNYVGSFTDCAFLGSQDTLYTGNSATNMYFKNCRIEGNTDYIFGEIGRAHV